MKKLSDTGRFKHYDTIVLQGFDPVSAGGFTQVPNFILKNKELTLGAKVSYATLLSYAWHNNLVFPGQDTMAKETGMGKRSIVRYIKELQDVGYLDVQRRGQGKTNVYVLSYKAKRKR